MLTLCVWHLDENSHFPHAGQVATAVEALTMLSSILFRLSPVLRASPALGNCPAPPEQTPWALQCWLSPHWEAEAWLKTQVAVLQLRGCVSEAPAAPGRGSRSTSPVRVTWSVLEPETPPQSFAISELTSTDPGDRSLKPELRQEQRPTAFRSLGHKARRSVTGYHISQALDLPVFEETLCSFQASVLSAGVGTETEAAGPDALSALLPLPPRPPGLFVPGALVFQGPSEATAEKQPAARVSCGSGSRSRSANKSICIKQELRALKGPVCERLAGSSGPQLRAPPAGAEREGALPAERLPRARPLPAAGTQPARRAPVQTPRAADRGAGAGRRHPALPGSGSGRRTLGPRSGRRRRGSGGSSAAARHVFSRVRRGREGVASLSPDGAFLEGRAPRMQGTQWKDHASLGPRRQSEVIRNWSLSQVAVVPTLHITTRFDALRRVTLTCHVRPFHPSRLRLIWMENRHKVQTVESPRPQTVRNPDGTFWLERTSQTQASWEGSEFACWAVQDEQPTVQVNVTLQLHRFGRKANVRDRRCPSSQPSREGGKPDHVSIYPTPVHQQSRVRGGDWGLRVLGAAEVHRGIGLLADCSAPRVWAPPCGLSGGSPLAGAQVHSCTLRGPLQRSEPGTSTQLTVTASGFASSRVATGSRPSGHPYNVTSSVLVPLQAGDVSSLAVCLVEHNSTAIFREGVELKHYLGGQLSLCSAGQGGAGPGRP
ncbi:hypothetical protein J0S82_018729 [Galemys pyrenaicus]|uniref:Ig-like domain-containing protein n=1 Tax=Galemys pyrenaicus TaxID=202257 RepID=A0A8J6A753_GALPY|nr:hypothetical protein J0S82_018729 [Galemys pyrenaicus]